MKKLKIFKCNNISSTSNAHYINDTTADNAFGNQVGVTEMPIDKSYQELAEGKYSIFTIANWFLRKSDMTQKKLQKLCYYAQAWCYAINNFRLIDSDFQAWIHGPVSPVLYEQFKSFGYSTIRINGGKINDIDKEDEELLEDVWATYGDMTGNALEALSHREAPWIEAREGYNSNERCTVAISPDSMKKYYSSIYLK